MEPDAARLDLGLILERFPEDAALVERLAVEDEIFRNICEDYALVRVTLVKFQNMPDARDRPEVVDYQTLASDLEGEIAGFLRNAKGSRRP